MIKSIVEKYKSKISDDRIYFSPEIPEKKLNNAIAEFARGESPESVLVLIDDSLFGSAKEGLLLSETSIYIKSLMEKEKNLLLENVEKVSLNKGLINYSIVINDAFTLESSMASKQSISKFVELLNDFIAGRKKDPDSNDINDYSSDFVLKELRLLKSMLDEGLITAEEYEEKRKPLLARL